MSPLKQLRIRLLSLSRLMTLDSFSSLDSVNHKYYHHLVRVVAFTANAINSKLVKCLIPLCWDNISIDFLMFMKVHKGVLKLLKLITKNNNRCYTYVKIYYSKKLTSKTCSEWINTKEEWITWR